MSDESADVPEEIKTWAKLGDIGHTCDYSADVLEELKPWINAGQVRIEPESNKYYQLLASKYPIGVNRIDWRGVRNYLVFDVLPADKGVTTGEEEETMLAKHRNILLDWFHTNGISLRECVVWTGDSTNVSLHMTIETLLKLYPHLFSWPQHHYVFPETGEWCLNYTMEGQLFFGRAENAHAHGYVDLDSP